MEASHPFAERFDGEQEEESDSDACVAASGPADSGSLAREMGNACASILAWPWPAKLFALALVTLYAPVVAEVSAVWLKDDSQAHGLFIFPVALFLIWALRHEIRLAPRSPSAWGLAPLAFGLLLETGSYLLRIKFLPMISLVPVLAGGILILHGRELWKVVRFVVLFLIFAAPMPDIVTRPTSMHVQGVSTTGAVTVMGALGYPLIQTGNRIDTPTVSVEVAEVCSGFKKLTALAAFAFLYGFVFRIGWGARALLVLAAYPVALLANIIRISVLIGIGASWGMGALHIAHDWAEIAVLVLSFGIFVALGKLAGCRTLRFSL